MKPKLRVLIGCEESGKVRDAFIRRGHDAWSNDLIPARFGGPHLQMDVREAIANNGPWDIIILHYDCTKTSLSGNGTYGRGKLRHQERLDDIEVAAGIWDMAKKAARLGAVYENPTSVVWGRLGQPRYYQPWMFGHGECKKTGLLFDRIPESIPTNVVSGREQRVWKMGPSPTRKRDRAETYQGIADALAAQISEWVEREEGTT